MTPGSRHGCQPVHGWQLVRWERLPRATQAGLGDPLSADPPHQRDLHTSLVQFLPPFRRPWPPPTDRQRRDCLHPDTSCPKVSQTEGSFEIWVSQ